MSFRASPATILSGLALFFALGGSALAVSHAVRPQPRCANGAVRGIAAVKGDPGRQTSPTSTRAPRRLFSRTFNCTGGAVQVRRVDVGVYDVRFAGIGAQSAVVSATNALSSLQPMPDGAFRVTLHIPGIRDGAEVPFVVIAV